METNRDPQFFTPARTKFSFFFFGAAFAFMCAFFFGNGFTSRFENSSFKTSLRVNTPHVDEIQPTGALLDVT